jgi:cell division protein FtsI (penicillin-binding protein 3)
MEHARATAPLPPAALEKTRVRLLLSAVGFTGLFAVLTLRLVYTTVIDPILPPPAVIKALQPQLNITPPPPDRTDIVDRNVSLPGAELYADPHQVTDPEQAAEKLASVLPGLDAADTQRRLASGKDFVYLDRQLAPPQELAVNRLGIPGVYFQKTETRHYPDGDLAAHILGGVGVGDVGIAGVEEYFNKRLTTDPAPLQLSIDAGIQSIVHDELAAAVKQFQAPGGCAIVMSAKTGEVLAMASLPDYNANDISTASGTAQFNRCVNGVYEPGSVFKLQTMSMALNSGLVHYWDYFDTTHPLRVGHFYIRDFEPAHVWMAMPQILNVSSNIGASRIASILGPKIEQAWYRKMGFFKPVDVQLPGPPWPQYPAFNNWGLAATMTVSFGGGIAISPLQLVAGVVPIVNGGIRYKPTLLAVDPNDPPVGVRVMKQSTSDIMRRMMTDVVAGGTGVYAAVPGYIVGGKTGTAQVVGPNGRYLLHTNNASFMAAFPMQDPQYVVYVLVLQPKPDAATHGFTTGGYIAAPTVGQIIARIGPMLGILPMSGAELAAQTAALTIPLEPKAPPGQVALGPNDPLPPGANAFAYLMIGLKPPGMDDTAPTRLSDQRAAQKAATLLPASPVAKRAARPVVEPVFPAISSHIETERALPADNEFAER